MDTQIATAVITALITGMGAMAFLMHKGKKKHRELLEFLAKRIDDLEDELSQNREVLDTGSQKFSDQARRIAWLETRIRKPKSLADEVGEDAPANPNAKWNVTEKRHKVLKLAGRGHGPESIASTLGIMRGEVELIINLGRMAA